MAAGAHSVRTEILFKAPAVIQENNIHLPPIPFKYTCVDTVARWQPVQHLFLQLSEIPYRRFSLGSTLNGVAILNLFIWPDSLCSDMYKVCFKPFFMERKKVNKKNTS